MKLKSTLATLTFSLIMTVTSTASAVDLGDRVYGVFGSNDSDLRVQAGNVIIAGNSSSKIEWDYCSSCDQWSSNSGLWNSRSSAEAYVKRKDSEHTSFGEGAAVVGVGIIFCLATGACT